MFLPGDLFPQFLLNTENFLKRLKADQGEGAWYKELEMWNACSHLNLNQSVNTTSVPK